MRHAERVRPIVIGCISVTFFDAQYKPKHTTCLSTSEKFIKRSQSLYSTSAPRERRLLDSPAVEEAQVCEHFDGVARQMVGRQAPRIKLKIAQIVDTVIVRTIQQRLHIRVIHL